MEGISSYFCILHLHSSLKWTWNNFVFRVHNCFWYTWHLLQWKSRSATSSLKRRWKQFTWTHNQREPRNNWKNTGNTAVALFPSQSRNFCEDNAAACNWKNNEFEKHQKKVMTNFFCVPIFDGKPQHRLHFQQFTPTFSFSPQLLLITSIFWFS